jgi:FKBP-type peptidyl-prolyl cis-trans isomerase (trigger factor)
MRSTSVEYLAPDIVKLNCHASSSQVREAMDEARILLQKRFELFKSSFANADENELSDKKFSEEALAQEATRSLAQSLCEQAVQENGFRLIEPPAVNIERMAQADEDFCFSAELRLVPRFGLKDYQNLSVTVPPLPELTDELVLDKMHSLCESLAKDKQANHADAPTMNAAAKRFGYEDSSKWFDAVRKRLEHDLRAHDAEMIEQEARKELAKLLDGELPAGIIQTQSEKMFRAFVENLESGGISLQDYCNYLAVTEEQLQKEMSDVARTEARESLALEALFDALGYEVSDQEIIKTGELLAEQQGIPREIAENPFDDQEKLIVFHEMTMHRMATEWLLEHIRIERSQAE